MPKHIPSEHYLSRPHEVIPKGIVHPEIQHYPTDAEHYLLPAVFTLEKREKFTAKYPGPGIYYITEGEIQYEDAANPGNPTVLGPGAIVHIEKGSALHWYSPSVAKGFAVFYVPVSIKGFESFVVSG